MPAGESECSLVYPDALPMVWENTMGNEIMGIMDSLPQGQLVQELTPDLNSGLLGPT